MNEQEVNIQSGEITLTATLCVPDIVGVFPCVLLVAGSGPLDRNGNMNGQQLNMFDAIAHALADYGIASLRYDKRGCGSSTGDFISAGYSDLLEDAVQCLDTLAKSQYLSPNNLYILGHSEGCTIATQISQRRPSVSGLILLCPHIERVESLLIRQAAQIEKEIDSMSGRTGFCYKAKIKLIGKPCATQQRLISKVQKTDLPVVRIGLSKRPAKWLREILALDIESIYSLTHSPMLLIAGEKDLQCMPQDAVRISKVTQSLSDVFIVDDMTHILRRDKNPASILGSAHLLREAIESVIVEKTAQWILAETANT